LAWLRQYAAKWRVDLLAYCLMPNHVHLVAVPSTADGLHRMMKPVDMRYAQRINRMQDWTGHLWQGRFFSSPLDEPHTWAAVRYVERNPVRAGLVRRAEEYRWSSALGHCGLQPDAILTSLPGWRTRFESVESWSAWLAEDDDDEQLHALRRHADKGLPCGSPAFVAQLEAQTARVLHYRPIGGQRKRKLNEGDATLYKG
jgi:putative transposase